VTDLVDTLGAERFSGRPPSCSRELTPMRREAGSLDASVWTVAAAHVRHYGAVRPVAGRPTCGTFERYSAAKRRARS
jgi:hypothetical protein